MVVTFCKVFKTRPGFVVPQMINHLIQTFGYRIECTLTSIDFDEECRNLSFGLTTKAKGVARLQAKRKEARESRQRHCKVAGQEEARELRQEEARESHHILLGVLESVREYEGVNPHTPKATPTLGDRVPVDSRNFRERLQGKNLMSRGVLYIIEKILERRCLKWARIAHLDI